MVESESFCDWLSQLANKQKTYKKKLKKLTKNSIRNRFKILDAKN